MSIIKNFMVELKVVIPLLDTDAFLDLAKDVGCDATTISLNGIPLEETAPTK